MVPDHIIQDVATLWNIMLPLSTTGSAKSSVQADLVTHSCICMSVPVLKILTTRGEVILCIF